MYFKASLFMVLLLFGGFLSAQSILENTQIRFFTDAGITASRDTSNALAPAFLFGGIEILITSQVTDKISLLAEPVLRPDGTVSMERVMIKYSFNNYFNISAGRLYTPSGLWNTTFFRYAKALTPTIDAPPIIANFEEGGTAINKDNGIQVSGEDISKLRLGYKVMIGNGYNPANSKKKSLYGNLFTEPIDNLRLATSITYQEQEATQFVGGGTLTAFGISFMYIGDKNFEIASEYGRGYYRSQSTNEPATSNVFFAYAGYRIKNITPYLQYYNGVLNFVAESKSATIGLRYNLSALSVLKAEAQFLEADDFAKVNQVKFIWAIGF